ncbi:DnaJ domain-containing protein [Tumebacillus sp. DT12]|uniref:DnaJ domain-containing protein n=1 Tax=Tumebacillus lacus TaxID=2995335 RepID=A0ABT3X4H1_9BACL|nr:DnaJ domain-containing protein [Tumebacillus lacus]MCX7571799.1 DnaJ domain-containing protein [Tumebacillus lacus]
MLSGLDEIIRRLQSLDLAALSETELAALHDGLQNARGQFDALTADVAWERAAKWWKAMPPEDMRTIRLLLKGARLTPQVLQGAPQYTPLLILLDIEDPNVVRLWAQMTSDTRAQRLDDLRSAMKLTEVRRASTPWDDRKESEHLAYEVLGMTASARWADIRAAYRSLAARHHPDKGGDPQWFKALQKAYALLESRYL